MKDESVPVHAAVAEIDRVSSHVNPPPQSR